MAKPELGTKRLCGSCGAKFYDLSKDPIICPKCGTTFVVVAPVSRRADAAAAAAAAAATAAAAAAAAKAKDSEEVPETPDAEFVSLERGFALIHPDQKPFLERLAAHLIAHPAW